MNIKLYHDINKICHITIMGELERAYDEAYFQQLIQENIDRVLYITFIDANILGNRVIERLYQLQQKDRVKLFVLKSYLFSYLYNLGIQSSYIYRRSLEENKSEQSNIAEPEEVMVFLQQIKEQYGYDYTKYELESIIRRIKACMLRVSIRGFNKFQEEVLQNEQIFEQLFLHLSVNTTEFFRDPEVYKEIKGRIISNLKSLPNLKMWCAGCSTGQEPYSLAILLSEIGLLNKTQIYATDINPFVIEEAKNGLYSLKVLENNICNYRKAGGSGSFMDYFDLKGEYIEVDEELKKNILFFQHSLDGNGILNEFQLIMCRNVLIYFTPELQRQVLERFSYGLDKNGFLILGMSEGVLHNGGNEFFYEVDKVNKIFKKK
ncbi:MAG TPA: protein-glutamate O-methyltransferase CheR [Patescibacteria group bacterium]|nr:protein-glutamate O-methyltransferase CheR [Patescibacteria group bacterium]